MDVMGVLILRILLHLHASMMILIMMGLHGVLANGYPNLTRGQVWCQKHKATHCEGQKDDDSTQNQGRVGTQDH